MLSLWVVEAHGLGANITTGIWLSFFMCFIKYLAACIPGPHLSFGITMIGQIFGAFGQPMLLNVAARLSMDYFGENERDYATTAATMSNILGQLVRSLYELGLHLQCVS